MMPHSAAGALFSLNSAILIWNEDIGKNNIAAINKTAEQLPGHPVTSASQGRTAPSIAKMMPEFIANMDEFVLTAEKIWQNCREVKAGSSFRRMKITRVPA